MKNFVQIIVFALLITSCASRLKVEVQIADRNNILKADTLFGQKNEYNPLELIEKINKFTNEWNSDEKLEPILRALYNDFSTGEVSENTKKQFTEGLNAKIDLIKEQVNKSRISFLIDNNTAKSKNQLNIALEQLYELDIAFKKNYKDSNGVGLYNSKFERVQANKGLRAKVDEQAFEKSKNIICMLPTLIKEAPVTLGTTRERFPILGDPLASYIAMKDNDSIWKSVFNKTVAWSVLGNSDIAMILRSNPPARELKSGDYNNNFTIKGVRMDASDASNALINGLTQTVNFIANTQGFPTNFGTNPASAANPNPTENPVIAGIQVDKDKLDIKKRKLIEYRQLLLKKIELENIVIAKDSETDVKAKAKRIKDYWDGLKAELNKP